MGPSPLKTRGIQASLDIAYWHRTGSPSPLRSQVEVFAKLPALLGYIIPVVDVLSEPSGPCPGRLGFNGRYANISTGTMRKDKAG